MCNVFFIHTIMHIHMVLSSATRGAHQRLRDLCEGIARAKLRCEYEYDREINAVDEAGVRASRRCRRRCGRERTAAVRRRPGRLADPRHGRELRWHLALLPTGLSRPRVAH